VPVSLLDRAPLDRVRTDAAGLPGPFAVTVAVLLHGGVVQHDPADPAWPDRDRLVCGSPDAAGAAAQALADLGYPRGGGFVAAMRAPALAVGLGMAAASRIQGGIFRVWCLLGGSCAGDGEVWEAAVAAAANAEDLLSAVVVTPRGHSGAASAMLRAAGWRVGRADATDPVDLLAAMDRLVHPDGAPGAVVAELVGP
jgi:transketolase